MTNAIFNGGPMDGQTQVVEGDAVLFRRPLPFSADSNHRGFAYETTEYRNTGAEVDGHVVYSVSESKG